MLLYDFLKSDLCPQKLKRGLGVGPHNAEDLGWSALPTEVPFRMKIERLNREPDLARQELRKLQIV